MSNTFEQTNKSALIHKMRNMKLFIITAILLLTVNTFGQKPEKVYSIAKERRAISWYEEQVTLWEKEVKKNKKNAEAWYNYYSAARALWNLNPWDSEAGQKYHKLSQKIADDAYATIPKTFEANHLVWWQSGNDHSKVSYLLKAHEIDPLDSRPYDDLMTYYLLKRDIEKYEAFCNKYFKANEMPASIYNWAYNILSELDKNAILLTVGDNDTYSTWVLQVAKSFRKDVHVINTSLIILDDYRNKLFSEIGLPPFKMNSKDIKSHKDYENFMKKLFDHILKNEKSIPVYVAGTAISQFTDDYADNLFVTGLAYKYSEKSFDNIALIRRNYEKRYLLDYLTAYFSFNISDNIVNQFNATYLPAFAKLYKHYKNSEEYGKMKQLEKYLLDISKKAGKETEINEILGDARATPNVFNTTLLNVKSIEKSFITLENNIRLNKYEVTNSEYQKFLKHLASSGNTDLLMACVYDSAKWVELDENSFMVPMKNMYHSHPAYANYPVVNISHFAAKSYCNWLTEQYNGQTKRKFNKVKFRLPSEKEWILAASEGKTNAQTYFDNDSFLDEASGKYRANLMADNGRFSDDGGFFTVKVDAYSPNEFGYYNLIGNVAEMVAEKGITKGGNWYLKLEDSMIPKTYAFDGPDPGVGFRLIMEIIEE